MHPVPGLIARYVDVLSGSTFCHTQAKLKLKAKLGWLYNQLEATATTTTVLFEPGALKPGALNPGASKSARDIKFGM